MKYSFIVPIYNGEVYIEKCLESLVNQTYKNFEIIVVNDGSTDNSLVLLKTYSIEYESIKVFNIENQGVANARNYGISKASGEYFVFVDIDDYVDINMLNVIENQIHENNSVDIIKYDYNVVKQKQEYKKIINDQKENFILKGTDAFSELVKIKKPFDLTCIYAYKMSFWKKNKFKFEIGRYHEDFGLIPYVIVKANELIIINKTLYYYVQTKNSETRNDDYQKQVKRFIDTMYHFDNHFKSINDDQTIDKNFKKVFNSYIANAVITRYKNLNKLERVEFKYKIENRNIVDLLLDDTFFRKLKKIKYKIVI